MQDSSDGTAPDTAYQPREGARPVDVADVGAFAGEADAIVVGGGGGGFAAALFLAWRGNDVLVLEKAAEVGGTSRKSGFGYWIPNNAAMRRAGLEDPRDDYLKLVAKLSRPHRFDPDSPRFGLTEWEYELAEAIYDSGAEAAEVLAEKGALPYRHQDFLVDYFGHLPEDKAPYGRVLSPRDAALDAHDGGEVAFSTMLPAAEEAGVRIVRSCRVQRLVVDRGAVVGVQGSAVDGSSPAYLARRAVVFATGGFAHDAELRENFLHVPAFPGCAARANEGDLIRIAGAAGIPMRNMSGAWMSPIPLEPVVAGDPTVLAMSHVAGDSMVVVNREGRRVANEKLPYNELSRAFFRKDPVTSEYTNLVLFQIWDERSQQHSAGNYTGLIVPAGADDSHVIRGETLEALAAAIAERLARYCRVTGGLTLVDDFAEKLRGTIDRFNQDAAEGVDTDFHRGETPIQQLFNGAVKDEGERPNPTMWPLSDSGPYYAALIVGSAMDTKGGPKVNADAQMVDDLDQPIPGLYGVGNCVASVSGGAYWAAGGTIGPMIAFAYRAAAAIEREPRRDFDQAATLADP